MSRRFLQVVGVLALLGLGGASVAALLTVREHLHVSIAGETEDRRAGPDPVALLRDDVKGLRGDLASLTQTLSRNFETLGTAEDERDAAQAKALEGALAPVRDAAARLNATVARLADRVAALESGADAREAASRREVLAALREIREGLGRPRAETASAPGSTAAPAAPTPPAPAAPPPVAEPAPAAAPPAPASPVPAAAPPAPATVPAAAPAVPTSHRKAFLSFSLPSESVDLAQRLRYEILPSLSRVGFDAKSTLHDFSGVTSDVSGSFTARLADPGSGATGDVRVQVATLDTGIEQRNAEMRGALGADRFPDLTFRLESFQPTSADARTLASAGTAHGKMTVHGVTRDVAFPLRVSVDESRRVLIEGELSMRMTDFGVTPPRKMGVIAVDDGIRVWVALRARAAGKAE